MTSAIPLEPHLAYCGLDCSGCDVYRATKFDDDDLRRQHARKVFDQFKVVVEPQQVNCHGCRDTRPKSGYCAWCEVRSCAIGRELENCAYCADFPCDKLDKVHAAMITVGKAVNGIASARLNLDAIRRTQGLD
jgi:hypothetical protein